MATIKWQAAQPAESPKATAAREAARTTAAERARATDPRTLRTVAELAGYTHDMAVALGARPSL